MKYHCTHICLSKAVSPSAYSFTEPSLNAQKLPLLLLSWHSLATSHCTIFTANIATTHVLRSMLYAGVQTLAAAIVELSYKIWFCMVIAHLFSLHLHILLDHPAL
jgi:hypothetical protein